MKICQMKSYISTFFAMSLFATSSVCYASFTTETPFSLLNDWEPTIAADKNSDYIYMAVVRDHEPTGNAGKIMMKISSDNGKTWGQAFKPCDTDLCNSVFQSDPHVVVGYNGRVILTFLAGGYKAMVVYSDNRGQSWSIANTDTAGTGWQDYPWIIASSNSPIVYLAFLGNNRAWVETSNDNGKTFQTPVPVSPVDKYWYFGNGGIAKDNKACIAETQESKDNTGTLFINCRVTTDGGLTWNSYPVATSNYSSRFDAMASVTMDAAGTIYYVYGANTVANEPKKLYMKKSTDCINWGPAKLLNAQGDNLYPAISTGATAQDLRLVWQNARDNVDNRYNTYFMSSKDGGTNWTSSVKLSNVGVTSYAPYKFDDGYVYPFGDYLSLSVDQNGVNHAVWGEGFDRSEPGGSWFSIGN